MAIWIGHGVLGALRPTAVLPTSRSSTERLRNVSANALGGACLAAAVVNAYYGSYGERDWGKVLVFAAVGAGALWWAGGFDPTALQLNPWDTRPGVSLKPEHSLPPVPSPITTDADPRDESAGKIGRALQDALVANDGRAAAMYGMRALGYDRWPGDRRLAHIESADFEAMARGDGVVDDVIERLRAEWRTEKGQKHPASVGESVTSESPAPPEGAEAPLPDGSHSAAATGTPAARFAAGDEVWDEDLGVRGTVQSVEQSGWAHAQHFWYVLDLEDGSEGFSSGEDLRRWEPSSEPLWRASWVRSKCVACAHLVTAHPRAGDESRPCGRCDCEDFERE